MRCEHMVDEFAPPPVNAAEVGTFGRQEPVEIPHPIAVTAVAGSKARSRSKVDLRAARALNDLRRRSRRFIVQVAAEDDRIGLPRARALAPGWRAYEMSLDLRWATIVTCSSPARTVADKTPRPSAADKASSLGWPGCRRSGRGIEPALLRKGTR
jgi:hypothetical protein